MSITTRIVQVVDSEKPAADFTRKTGISSSNIANWRKYPYRSVQFDSIIAILEGYPNLSAEWLMRGEGFMFSQNNYNSKTGITNVKEDEVLYNSSKTKCVLTGADCSFREMDTLRIENAQLRKELGR